MKKQSIGLLGMLTVMGLVIAFLAIGFFGYFDRNNESQQITTESKEQIVEESEPLSTAVQNILADERLVEDTNRYVVDYPANYYVLTDRRFFSGEQERAWVAANSLYATTMKYPLASVSIVEYRGLIPTEMPLDEWLRAVGDPVVPIGAYRPRNCADKVNKFPDEIKSNELYAEDNKCLFVAIRNIRPSSLREFQAATFETYYVTATQTWNTLVRDPFDPTSAYLISEVKNDWATDEEYELSGNAAAYQMLLDTLELHDPAELSTPLSIPTVSDSLDERSQVITDVRNWEIYTSDDTGFGIRTTMAMPPGFTFTFSGSESTISNETHSEQNTGPTDTEIWDYSSSVYCCDENGSVKNHFEGGSPGSWYVQRLSDDASLVVISVEEKPLDASSYFKFVIQSPVYDEHARVAGTRNEVHYVFVQDEILHMITPISDKASAADAQIPANIEQILSTLSSVRTD